jgi:TRAP-type C4-dicarboxylate transport system substrate-binding protein/esterase/lipase superfamily enzyme
MLGIDRLIAQLKSFIIRGSRNTSNEDRPMLTRMILLSFLLILSVPSPGQAQQQLRIAIGGVAPESAAARAAQYYREQINGSLDGRARIELKPMTFPQAFDSVQKGDVEMAPLNSSGLASYAKISNFALFDLPFFFESLPEAAAIQNTIVGEAMLGAVNPYGMVGLAYWNSGMTQFFGKKPIQRIDNLQNLKLRTFASPPALESLEALGVKPFTTILARDVDRAMYSGSVDVVETLPFFVSRKIVPLSPLILSEVNYRPYVFVLVANAKSWKEIPLRIQSELAEQARSAADRANKEAFEIALSSVRELKEQKFFAAPITTEQVRALGDDAASSWRNVRSLQDNNFLDGALEARAEFRRINSQNIQPRRRTDVPSSGTQAKKIRFATDREDQGGRDPAFRFAGKRGKSISWGVAEVAVSPEREFGSGDAATVKLDRIYDRTADTFVDELKSDLTDSPKKALVYVHGFRNTFKNAAEGAAQIAIDVGFSGPVIIFSWPSDGIVLNYPNDGEQVLGSRDNAITVLKAISSVDDQLSTNILTHSMGGRVATEFFRWLSSQPATSPLNFYHLILAAPDVRVNLFKGAANGMRRYSKRVSLYASDWDQALRCAQFVNGGARAGQAGSNRVVLDQIDTIDVSNVEHPSWFAVERYIPCTPSGHGYISQNPAVLADLYELLTYDKAPPRQRLRQEQEPQHKLPYWVFK